MTMYKTPIKPKRISDQVYDQIKELIFSGQLKPGERLMAEREMANVLNVSRSSVRKAIQRLTNMGIISQIQGKGTFVSAYEDKLQNPLALAIEAQDISLENLMEVRIGLESSAAYMAAKRADEADIEVLERSVHQMEQEHCLGRLGSHADTTFHMAVAIASKNPLNIMIMRNFYDYIYHGIRENLEGIYEDSGNMRLTLEQHLLILEAIKKKDSESAYQAMKDHIFFVIKMFGEQLDH